MTSTPNFRVAVVASHPIQYFTPIYRILASEPGIDLEVFYCRDFGVNPRFDKQFGRQITWDTDLLSGYQHRFLFNASPIRDPFNPLHAINPGILTSIVRGFDALWINGFFYPTNWMATAAGSLRRTRLLLRSELRSDPRPRRWHSSMRDQVIQWWIRRADGLLYIGRENRAAYLRFGAREEQLFFSPYACDVDRLAAARRAIAPRRTDALREWGLPENRALILFVGKFIDFKQPAAMLHLADDALMRDRAQIVMVGSGPLEASLRAECERRRLSNVTMLGFINQSRLPDLYGLADIFVMPSVRESWGLTLSEAMAAGAAPVACDNVGAASDLISVGETGLTFPVADWDALVSCTRTLVLNTALRERIARNAQVRSSEYSYSAAADGILAALGSLRPRLAATVRKNRRALDAAPSQ